MDLQLLPAAPESGRPVAGFFRSDLPNSYAVLIEFRKEMDDVVRVMCPGFRFVCLLDGVVAAIYPRLLPGLAPIEWTPPI